MPCSSLQNPCPIHQNQELLHFCSSQACLQFLCAQCVPHHKQIHATLKISTFKLLPISAVSKFYRNEVDHELKYLDNKMRYDTNHGVQQPCQIVCQQIDRYFHGSLQSKFESLKKQHKLLEESHKVPNLIKIIEENNLYAITSNFKQKYFVFLDQLLDDLQKNQ